MIVPLLAWLLLASPLLADHLSVRPTSQFNCWRSAGECADTNLERFPRIHRLSDLQQQLANRTMVVEMANALERTTTCLEQLQALPICHEHFNWVSVLRLNVNFLNLPGITDQIVAVSQSPCLTEEIELAQATYVMSQCVITFEEAGRAHMENLCQGFSQLWECVESASFQYCGDQYGELFAAWKQFVLSAPKRADFLRWLRAETQIDFNVCEEQVTVTRRYINTISLLTKKI